MLPAGEIVAGWDSHPLKNAALSRRTPDPDIPASRAGEVESQRGKVLNRGDGDWLADRFGGGLPIFPGPKAWARRRPSKGSVTQFNGPRTNIRLTTDISIINGTGTFAPFNVKKILYIS